MRGSGITQEKLFSYRTLEVRIPSNPPLRGLRQVVDLLHASLLQVLFSIRSERQWVKHIDFILLYRWFVGLTMDDAVWDHFTFSANRDRLLNERISRLFFERVLALSAWKKLDS